MRNGNKSGNLTAYVVMLVLILPMRNGNSKFPAIFSVLYKVRSYPTYEEWKQRNAYPEIFPKSFVLILPMRNGNTSISFFSLDLQLGSYPTYEEWKLVFLQKFQCFFNSSYPTYEEWKHKNTFPINSFNCNGSYPTYEEWKRIKFQYLCLSTWVLILPMRNGNNPLLVVNPPKLNPFLSYL